MCHPEENFSVKVVGNVMIERWEYLRVLLDELHVHRSRGVNGKIRQMVVNGEGVTVFFVQGAAGERNEEAEMQCDLVPVPGEIQIQHKTHGLGYIFHPLLRKTHNESTRSKHA